MSFIAEMHRGHRISRHLAGKAQIKGGQCGIGRKLAVVALVYEDKTARHAFGHLLIGNAHVIAAVFLPQRPSIRNGIGKNGRSRSILRLLRIGSRLSRTSERLVIAGSAAFLARPSGLSG